MQVYRRVANPYMPQGTASKTNAPTPLYAPGELGCTFVDPMEGRAYLRVLIDSGATSATPVGAVKTGQLAFWKDRTRGIATTDPRFCEAPGVGGIGAINQVIGIIGPTVPTVAPGVNGADGQPIMYATDLILEGKAVNVQATGTLFVGAQATMDSTAGQNRVLVTTGVNTAPLSQVIGVCRSTVIAGDGTTPLDVKLPFSDGVV